MERERSLRCFKNSFWEKDYTSSEGFDRLQRHMSEGCNTCEVTEKLLKKRAKVDEDYAKALKKISRAAGETREIGSLRNSLDCLKNEFEKMAQSTLESVAQMNDICTRISEFQKLHESSRKNLEASITKHAKDKSTYYKRTMEAKKLYHIKSQEAENAASAVMKAKVDTNCSERDFEKISSQCSEAQQAASKAEREYRTSVTKLSEITSKWEKDMNNYCEVCEEMDEMRLSFLKEQLWEAANIISCSCVEIDGKCEVIRNSLENVNVDADMTSFVNRASTGSDPPDAVRFEAYGDSRS